MHSRKKNGSDRESRKRRERKREEEKGSASLPNASRVHPTPRLRFSLFVEGTAAAATGPACHYLIFIHSAHCFWITGCPPAPFVIAYFYPRPAGRPAVIYFGTEIRFAKHRAAPIVFRIERRLSL